MLDGQEYPSYSERSMMNEHKETTIAQDAVQEELVAYLDGELDAAARPRRRTPHRR